ncbi:hypothetical protein BH23ACT4_BH23ACT4_00830 [soil metagenome]
MTACNVHELGHAVVATALGWRVETINLCLPGGGSVGYSHVGKDYTERFREFPAVFVPLLVISGVVGVAATAYTWRWR